VLSEEPANAAYDIPAIRPVTAPNKIFFMARNLQVNTFKKYVFLETATTPIL
jgi:hypothetical protein